MKPASDHITNVYDIIKNLSETVGPISVSLDLDITGSGTGDVIGPNGATDNAIAIYNGITGKIIKNSLVTLDNTGNIFGIHDLSTSGTITGSNLSGTNTGDETPSDILIKLMTVDGSGSGLDADLLDGYDALYFQPAGDYGDVVGPSFSTDNAIAIFDGTTGKLIKNSLVLIDSTGYITGATAIDINGGWSAGITGVTIGETLFSDIGIFTTGGILLGDISGNGGQASIVRASNGVGGGFGFYTWDSSDGLLARWSISVDDDESGANSGSNLRISAFSDTGIDSDSIISLYRDPTIHIQVERAISILGGYGAGLGVSIVQGIIGAYQLLVGDTTTAGGIYLNRDSSGSPSIFAFFSNGENRWINGCINDETGGDSGSDYTLKSYDDTGGEETVILIPRKSGETMTIYRPLHLNGGTA